VFVIEALRLERKGYESYTVVVDRADVATETERKAAVEKFKAPRQFVQKDGRVFVTDTVTCQLRGDTFEQSAQYAELVYGSQLLFTTSHRTPSTSYCNLPVLPAQS